MILLFRSLALLIMFVLLAVPNAPIQVRYLLAAFVVLAAFLWRELLDHAVLQWQTWLVSYAIFMGMIVMVLYDDGSSKTIFTPVRDLVLAGIAVMAFRGRSRTVMLSFASLWTLVQLLALIDEYRHGLLWPRTPIPIVDPKEKNLLLYSSTELDTTRFGGLTFESSVVGSMAAIFAVFALMVLTAPGKTMPWHPWRRFDNLMAWFIFISAATINILAKTKAGAIIVLTFGLAYLVAGVLSGRLFTLRRALGFVGVVTLVLGLGWAALRFEVTQDFADYAGEQLQRLKDLFQSGGLESVGSSGLGTRLGYYELTALGLPFHPLGVGSNSGFLYAKPVLHKLIITDEMDTAFSKGRYGVQTPFCAVIVWTGFVGLVVFWFMLRAASRRMRGGHSGRAVAWTATGLTAYVIFIIGVGMTPYLAILIFLVEAARSCYDRDTPESTLIPETRLSGRRPPSRRRKMNNGGAAQGDEGTAPVPNRAGRYADGRTEGSNRSRNRKEEEPGGSDHSDE